MADSALVNRPHICGFFNSPEEANRLILPFIQEGLERGEKGFHTVDPARRAAHVRELASGGTTRSGRWRMDRVLTTLLAYEARANYSWLRHEGPFNPVICAYDLRRFRGDIFVDVMLTHPLIILAGVLQENPFFVPPDEFLEQLRERAAS